MYKRHTVLFAAGLLTAGLGASAETATGQEPEISGTITYQAGAKIPEGQVEIYLEDPTTTGNRDALAAKTQLKADGGSKSITFSLSTPAGTTASTTLQVVARLEREDGWLLARGSAKVVAGAPVDITLFKAMY